MSQIKAGDLAVWSIPHCKAQDNHPLFGLIAKVDGPAVFSAFAGCSACGASFANEAAVWWNGAKVPPRYLKRIPPLDELESEKNKEELSV